MIYVLDEPTTGLHLDDVRKLTAVLDRLLARGDSVIVIEHHLDVIAAADHVLELVLEAGEAGGRLVPSGTPEAIAAVASSHTGRFLRQRRGVQGTMTEAVVPPVKARRPARAGGARRKTRRAVEEG